MTNSLNFLDKIRENITSIDENMFFSIYIESYKEKKDDIYFNISGEIFNDDILKYDNDNNENNEKRFFVYGYNGLEISRTQFLQKMGEFIDENINCPNFANCNEYSNDCELYNFLMERPYDLINKVDCFIGLWNDSAYNYAFKGKFSKVGKRCNVFFSASPFIFKRKSIVFDDKIKYLKLEKIKFDNCEGLSVLKKIFDDLPKPEYLELLNVGQGLFVNIKADNKNIIYDPGFTFLEDHTSYINTIGYINNVKADIIIISHLDLDHFLGVVYLPDEIFNKTWIISYDQNDNISKSAMRLISYLQFKKANVCLIDDPGKVISINNYSLGQGLKKKIGKCNERNNGSLIFKINDEKCALLTGDCIYEAIPKDFEGNIDLLQIPHHGCELENFNNIDFFGKRNSIAMVSVGKNPYNHPFLNHLMRINGNGFAISRTSDFNIKFVYYLN